MAKNTRRRVASVLADIANEDDDRPEAPPSRIEPPADDPGTASEAPSEAPTAGPSEPTHPAGEESAAVNATPSGGSSPASNRRAGAASSRAPGLGHLLNNWGEQSREAELWRRAVGEGAVVREFETDRVSPFRWHDRFSDFDDGPEFEALVDSIMREGQIAPALVRPHPGKPGTFELVYGHRRHRACVRLGRPLRAILRDMDDETAVTFLSRENSQHAPPSFIERARQADRLLKDTGWTVQFTADVLGVQRSEVSRYRMVMTLPDRVVMQIGGDPTIGRPAWMSLETLWRDPPTRERIEAELDHLEQQEIRGARAMRRLVAAGKPRAETGAVFQPRDSKGPVMRRDVTSASDRLVIDKRLAGGFGDFLWDQLDDLWAEWQRRQG